MPHIVVLSNETSGSGKTVTAIQLIFGLLSANYNVVSIDLDFTNQVLSSFLTQRSGCFAQNKLRSDIYCNSLTHITKKQLEITESLQSSIHKKIYSFGTEVDFIIIDTSKSCHDAMKLAHECADTIITPLCSSEEVLKCIGQYDTDKIEPSSYSNQIWQCKLGKAADTKETIDWIVLCTGSTRRARETLPNKLEVISRRYGFRMLQGFSDYTTLQNLIAKALVLTDFNSQNDYKLIGEKITLPIVLARQELKEIMTNILKWNKKQYRLCLNEIT